MPMLDPTIGAAGVIKPAEVKDVELYHPKSWVTKSVFPQDAKVIAVQYSITALSIGLVALVLSWLIRLQLAFPSALSAIGPGDYLQFITMHGMIMVIYLLTALFLGGFGNYLIPLMVGARDMVFPYVNVVSYWVYLLAVLVRVASFFVPGGPTGAGWTLYPPQAILSGTPGQDWGIVLVLDSLILFIIGFTMGGLNYVVTVLQARTRGMTLMRMPLTVWGIFTATVIALLAFPALFVGCVMLLFDRILGTSFFMPALVEMGQHLKYRGGSPLLFQHLFWFFGHPEVYIVAVPAFGIVSDLIATHARKNIFGYRMMVWAIVVIGALSFVVWAHHMYVSGMNPYFGFFFAATTLIIAIPTAIKVYNWVLTLWRGDIHLTVPMLFALSFIVTFVNGGLTGLFLGNPVVDVPLSDTMFVVAHFHMVMGMAPIFVIFGAIYHWYPKVTGRMLNETLGQFHFWVTFLGAYALYTQQAQIVHGEVNRKGPEERDPEGKLAERLVQHSPGDLRVPMVDRTENHENGRHAHHHVKVGDDEHGVGQRNIHDDVAEEQPRQSPVHKRDDEGEGEQHRDREVNVAAPQSEHPVVDLDGRWDGDDERGGGEEEPEIRVHAAHIHVVRPYDEAEGTDDDDRPHHHAIAEDVFSRMGGDQVGDNAEGRHGDDVDLGMAEEPEQVLKQ